MMAFHIERWPEYFREYLASGLVVTLAMWAACGISTILFALPVALLRASRWLPLRLIATTYIELFRGTPLLVQMLAFFALLPIATGIVLPPWPTAVLVITLNAGSYLAESYRSGVQAVSKGQREAAEALGLSSARIWTRVVLPQAVRIIQPSVGTILVAVLLATSFAYLVGVVDLMAQTENVQALTTDFSVFLFATLLYGIMALLLTWGNSVLERRLRIP
jgi:His/Glu/Gln/Arg/opine family amino acid ABC transporter permease subunit